MKRVYLDQNHWSYLSLALGGQPRTPEEAEAAKVIVRSVANQEASFPLSTAHVFETWMEDARRGQAPRDRENDDRSLAA
jgi:hypothetical protein